MMRGLRLFRQTSLLLFPFCCSEYPDDEGIETGKAFVRTEIALGAAAANTPMMSLIGLRFR